MKNSTRWVTLFVLSVLFALTAARADAQSEVNVWTSLGLEDEDGDPVDAFAIAASRTPPTRLYATNRSYSIFVGSFNASTPGSPPRWDHYTHVPEPTMESPFFSPHGVVVDPNDPLRAYVAASTRLVVTNEAGVDFNYPSGGWGCMLGLRVWTAPAGGTLYVTGFAPLNTSLCPDIPGYGCALFRSTDDGAHWTCVDAIFNAGALDLAVDPLDSDRVFAAIGFGSLARSLDGAETWEVLDSAPDVSRLAIDPFNPSVVWLGAANGELWRTDDGGATFERIAGAEQGLPEASAVDLLVHRVDPKILYLAYVDHGVFATLDGGVTFRKLDEGLPTGSTVRELALDPAEPSRLYAATSSGVYTILHEEPRPCVTDQRTLCLLDGRFELRSRWRDFRARPGFGTAVSLSSDSGYFWFFDESNLELVAKALDGNALNDRFWLFYGALSNVEFELVVTDTQTGEVKGYFNPSRTFASRGDTDAFPRGVRAGEKSIPIVPVAPIVNTTTDTACAPDDLTLCLGDGRFRVRASWKDFKARVGVGHAAPLNETTGTFWFFNEENTEIAIKVLDGRAINDHFWVFYGALSNVEYTLIVDDLETGKSRVYLNPLHQFASRGDTAAFAE